MGDTIDIGLGRSGVNLQTLQETNLGTIPQGPTKIRDTAATSHSEKQKEIFSPSGAPKIPPPADNADPMGITNLHDQLKNFMGDVLAASNMIPTPDNSFTENVESELGDISGEQLKNMKTGLPNSQVIKMVRFSVYNPDAKMPESIKEAATEIRNSVISTTGQQPSGFIANLQQQSAGFGYSTLFQSEVMNSGLSPQEQQQVLAAFDMPEFAAQLSPAQQKVLASAQETAFKGVQKDVGIPNNWEAPKNPEGYKAKVNKAFDKKIGDKLYEKMQNGEISRAAYNDMRTLHYIPGSSPPNAQALKGQLNTIVGESKTETQEEWGFPNDYQPTTNSNNYHAILTGTYFATAKKAIASQTPPLSADEQTQVINALKSPAAKANLSPKLSGVLASAQSAATAKVAKQYSLPDSWSPDPVMLSSIPTVSSPKTLMAQNAISLGLEYVGKAQTLAKNYYTPASTPDPTVLATVNLGATNSPFGTNILDYLKVVSQALSALSEILYASEITNSDMSQMLVRIQTDASIGKLAAQRKQLKSEEAQEAKEASLGPLKWILLIIICLLILLSAGMLGMILGPILAGAGAALFANTVAQAAVSGNLDDPDMFQALATTMGELGTAMGSKAFGEALASIFTILLLVLCPYVLLADLTLGSGSSITTILEGFGVPPTVAGYITMAISIIAMVAMMIVTAFFAPELEELEVGAIVAKVSAQLGAMLPRVIMETLNAVMQFLEKAISGISMVDRTTEVVNDVLKSIKQFFMKGFLNIKQDAKEVEKTAEMLSKAIDKTLKQAQKLQDLKDSGAKVKDIAKQEAKLAESQAEEDGARAAKTEAEEYLKGSKDFEERISKAEEKIVNARAKLKWLEETGRSNESGPAKDELKAAQQELKKAQDEAVDRFIMKTTKKLESLAEKAKVLEEEHENAKNSASQNQAKENEAAEFHESNVQMLKDAEKSGDQELINNMKTVRDESEKALQDARTNRQASDQEVSQIQAKLSQTEKEYQEANQEALAPLGHLEDATGMVNNMVQNGVQINNDIIKARIAMMQGQLDAYIVSVDNFIHMLQALIAKFLKSLQELGADLAALGKMMHEFWVSAGAASSSLSHAM